MSDEILVRHTIYKLNWLEYFERDTGVPTGFYVPSTEVYSDYWAPEYLADPVAFDSIYTESRSVLVASCAVQITSNRPTEPREFSQRTYYTNWIRNDANLAFGADPVLPGFRFRKSTNPRGFEIREGLEFFPYPNLGHIIEFDGSQIALEEKLFARKGYIAKLTNHPNYRSLVGGYSLDARTIPDNPVIIPTETKTIKLKYYQQNKLEAIPDLKSIGWRVYECNLTKDIPSRLPITDCVLGTLYSNNADTLASIAALPTVVGKYAFSDLLPSAIPALFANWNALYDAQPFNPDDLPIYPQTIKLHKLAANNNVWHNTDLSVNVDIEFDTEHPMFVVDDATAFDWHISPQPEGIGTLTMDSPRTIEIHAALDAAKFATNSLNPSTPRITNLGHLIAKCAELLGYHPNDNGEYIVADEKQKIRRIVKDEEQVDEAEYGGNYFASKGMLFNRLPNAFNAKGEIVSGGVAMVHNIPELLAEIQDQLRIALNLQESGAIEIKDGDRTYRYSGQLQLLTDLALGVAAIHQLVHQGYISSLVTQQQSGEIIAGMGLPTVSRVTNMAIDNVLEQVPYWGIAPQHSLARKIDTVGYNVGIITGQLI